MAPVEITEDYYAILEVSQIAKTSDIKKSYHRLAILLHPDKNQDKPDATASFQLLGKAYETLKDESLRQIYDIRWPHIAKTYQAHQEKAKQEAEAATAESERSAKEKAVREAEEQKTKLMIERLETRKRDYDSKIFEIKREITRIQLELKNIRTVEEKALAEERARNSWSTYIYSSVFGATEEPYGLEQEQELQRLQRVASKTIKEAELSREENKLKQWNALLSGVQKTIIAENANLLESQRQAERQQAEAKWHKEAKARKKKQDESMERERANRAAAEAQAAKARATQEERWKKENEERRKREAERAEEWRKILEQTQKEREQQQKREAKEVEERRKNIVEMMREMNMRSEATSAQQSKRRKSAATDARTSMSSSASCQHRGWWDKVDQGNLKCEKCYTKRAWLLQCPNCEVRACAGCRKTFQIRGGDSYKAQARVDRRGTPSYDECFSFDTDLPEERYSFDPDPDPCNWYD